jgi:hypothetical protein
MGNSTHSRVFTHFGKDFCVFLFFVFRFIMLDLSYDIPEPQNQPYQPKVKLTNFDGLVTLIPIPLNGIPPDKAHVQLRYQDVQVPLPSAVLKDQMLAASHENHSFKVWKDMFLNVPEFQFQGNSMEPEFLSPEYETILSNSFKNHNWHVPDHESKHCADLRMAISDRWLNKSNIADISWDQLSQLSKSHITAQIPTASVLNAPKDNLKPPADPNSPSTEDGTSKENEHQKMEPPESSSSSSSSAPSQSITVITVTLNELAKKFPLMDKSGRNIAFFDRIVSWPITISDSEALLLFQILDHDA